MQTGVEEALSEPKAPMNILMTVLIGIDLEVADDVEGSDAADVVGS